jgi:hypothetical protein
MNELIQLLQQVKRQWGQETVAAIVAEMQRQNLSYQGRLQESISFKQDETLDGNITFDMTVGSSFFSVGGVENIQLNKDNHLPIRRIENG